MSLLRRNSWRYLLRHPTQIGLAILGVALGVAVVVAIDLANASAQRAFSLSTATISGPTTDQIVGGADGLSPDLYRDLRVQLGLDRAAPVIEAQASVPAAPGRSFSLLGIDPLTEAAFRPYLLSSSDITPLITEPRTVLLSTQLAQTLGVTLSQSLPIRIEGITHTLSVVGLLDVQDTLNQQALSDVLVVDISTASEILGRSQLDRIDLILPADQRPQLQQQIKALLPPGASLTTPQARSAALDQMTKAFEVNLQALSLLALIVGLFLIYNTMTFSVVQRRTLFGTLRSLGVTRREVFRLILVEASLIGSIGAAVGLLFGIILGRGLVQLVTQTINDLYFALNVRQLQISPLPLVKGLLLGLGGTTLAAMVPALEATFAPPRLVLRRSSIEDAVRRRMGLAVALGVVALGLGGVLLRLPSRSLALSFAGVFLIVLGAGVITPGLTIVMMRVAQPLLGRFFGLLGRMAARDVIASLSRTGVAIAALMIAVAVTVGANTMITSFRQTVVDWLDATLTADIFISVPSSTANRSTALIEPQLATTIMQTPGTAAASTALNIDVPSPYGTTALTVVQPAAEQHQRSSTIFLSDADAAWQGFFNGGVWISEPYATRTGLAVGDQLELQSTTGPASFPIVGVYADFSSDRGLVSMHRDTFNQHWSNDRISTIALWAAPDVSVAELQARVQQRVGTQQALSIQANRQLRQATLEIFDRTFLITGVLQILGTGVAFIGILSALMALQLERARDLGILRAVGLTPRQLWGLVLSQTSLIGLTAGLLALPLGLVLAYILVFVINKRSFGWTLQLQVSPQILLQALGLALTAALLGGIYPAWRMARSSPALALRDE